MSSAQTYELRDILMLMNESIDSFKKSEKAFTNAVENAKDFNQLMEGLKNVNTTYTRGMVRLSLAYDKIVIGAKLEEEKEKAKDSAGHSSHFTKPESIDGKRLTYYSNEVVAAEKEAIKNKEVVKNE